MPHHHLLLRISMYLLIFLLIICDLPCVLAVQPVWRTPVALKKNVSRTQRALSSSNAYYTRPEDFKIPDYRPAKPNGFTGVNVVNVAHRTPQSFRPQFRPAQHQYQQPQYPQLQQPYPNSNQNPYWNGAPIPPHAVPYLQGPAAVPPQGVYGPQQHRPSARPPVDYTGIIPMSPAAHPDRYPSPKTTPYYVAEKDTVAPIGYTPATSPKDTVAPVEYTPAAPSREIQYPEPEATTKTAYGGPIPPSEPKKTLVEASHETDLPEDIASYTQPRQSYETTKEIFGASKNPYTVEETTTGYAGPTLIPDSGYRPYPEEEEPPSGTSEYSGRPAESTNQNYETEPPGGYEKGEKVRPILDQKGSSYPREPQRTPELEKDMEEAKAGYFPRPVAAQAYQPPGHLPEDFSEHIDVNFKKPTKTCAGALCGVDTDKVSLYSPDKSGRKGPVLVISNAAKGDAARLGYIPPAPKVHPDAYGPQYTPFPQGITAEDEYSNPSPSYHEEPLKPNVPSVPHTFMSPQNFPMPPAPTNERYTHPPVAYQTEEYSPTAKTLAPATDFYAPQTTTEATTTVETEDNDFYAPSVPPNTDNPYEGPYRPSTSHPHIETTNTYEQTTEVTDSLPSSSPSYFTEEVLVTTPPRSSEVAISSARPSEVPSSSTRPSEVSSSSTRPSEVPSSSTRPSESSTSPSKPTTATTTTTIAPATSTASSRTESHTVSTVSILGEAPSTKATVVPNTFSEKTTTVPPTVYENQDDRATTPKVIVSVKPGSLPVGPPAYPTGETPSPNLPPSPPAPHRFSIETTVSPYHPPQPLEITPGPFVPNRIRGKAHIVCQEEGIQFSAAGLFNFTGQVFANERKRVPSCVKNFSNEAEVTMFLPFAECGVRNSGEQDDNRAQYHMQVVVVFNQTDGSSTIQSFMAQCVHQKLLYNKQTLPRRIEEALEELRLVGSKLEQKAPLPGVQMRIVVDKHHDFGPEVTEVDIGMPIAVQWTLLPLSDAYGFHVRNCTVQDTISGLQHRIIDEHGCSTDLSILAHPHYDTYHDTAFTHLWAFKVPDHSKLRIRCDVLICSDIPSSSTNISSCASIPSPPFCPDLITSPSNSILYDAEGAFLKRRRETDESLETQSVRAALCMGPDCGAPYYDDNRWCMDTRFVATSTGFSVASLLLAILVNVVVRVSSNRKTIQ